MNPRMALTTERLVLRLPQPEDVRAVQEAIALTLPELAQWMPRAIKGQTQAQTRAYIYTQMALFVQDENLSFGLFDNTLGRGAEPGGGACLGMVELGLRVPQVPSWEVSFWTRSDVAGRGLMAEALLCMKDFALETLKARRVFLRTEAANVGACRVAAKAGLVQEGILRNDSVDVAGEPADTVIYAVTR